jgi:DNA-binding SARP family transcriptional activator/predicted ATPase/class 3 adenylate cyclase
MTKLKLELLGGFRLKTDAGGPVPLPTKKARALLAYLALHPSQAQARPKLAGLLWGDRGEVQARDSLRQTLSLLRKALSQGQEHALVAQADTIALEPASLNVDAVGFMQLAAQTGPEELEEAAKLYCGEFLEGFEVRAPEFEGWAASERQRFREKALETLDKLLNHHLAVGATERAIHTATRLLVIDPIQESAHRTLMELHCRQGRYSAALRQYRACAELLAKELGIAPDATTKALHRDILRRWNKPSPTTSVDVVPTQPVADIADQSPARLPRSLERRQVTVIACRLIGIAALASQLDPEELRTLLGRYHARCLDVISRAGARSRSSRGDELLACFGYPQADEHDAERAVRAGLELIRAVSELEDFRVGRLNLRIGIATGSVVIGELTGSDAREQEFVGEATQRAAGLGTFAGANTVVIEASTRRLVGSLFEYSDLGSMALEGSAGAVRAWRVLETSTIDSRFEALRAHATPMVGRDEEIELLMRRWQQAQRGEGCVVLMSGEPGVGKSRIAHTLQDRLVAEPHTCLRAFCSPHHQDSALYPTITQLERAAEFGRHDTAEQKLLKLEAVLGQATNELNEVVPLLADLLSVPIGDHYPPLNLTPQKRKEKTLKALVAQVEGLAARESVLVVFEDVQWSDPTTRDLLDLLAERVAALRVLLILTYRPEFSPPWIGRPNVTLLSLSRLPPRQCAEMIAQMTGGKALPKQIVDQIIDRTDGVPLFIEELTKTIVESGMSLGAGDRSVATAPAAPVTMPATLQASLLARLDRVGAAREVAQIGAALGRRFSHELISAVADMPQPQLDHAMEQLVRAELIFRRGSPPDAQYTFKHALVEDAAYSMLLRNKRQELHTSIAQTLEQRFSEICEAQPELIAHHFTEAGRPEAAIAYWHKAGQKAVQRSANREAVGHLTKALDLLRKLPDTAERAAKELPLQRLFGTALMVTRGFAAPETGASFSRARELALNVADSENTYPTLLGVWAFEVNRANHVAAREIAREILARAQARDDPEPRIIGHYARGVCDFHKGALASARRHFEQALDLYEVRPPAASFAHRYGLEYGATTSAYSSWCHWLLGYPGQALRFGNQAKAVLQRAEHAFTASRAFFWSALLHQMRGEWSIVDRQADRLITSAEDQGYPVNMAIGHILRGAARAALGDGGLGIRELLDGLEAYSAAGTRLYYPHFLCLLAGALRAKARPAQRLAVLVEASDLVEETGERYFEAEIHRLKGDLLLASGEAGGTEIAASYQRALNVARAQQARSLELRAATRLARLWRDQSRRTDARDLLAPIYSWFTEGFDTRDLKEAKAVLDELAS